MAGKTSNTSLLTLRRRTDGSTSVVDPPDKHTFSSGWIGRMIPEGLVSVTLSILTDDGPHTYVLQGFDGNPDAWVCERVAGKEAVSDG